MCMSIADILAANAASNLIDDGANTVAGTVITMPSWIWIVPVIDVGRKGVAANGDLNEMPTRIVWSTGPVLVREPNTEVTLQWHITGMGHDVRGELTVPSTSDMAQPFDLGIASILPPVVRAFSTNSHLARILRAMVKAGNESRWSLVSSLETFALQKLVHANSTVAAELGEHNERAISTVIDEIAIDDLLSEMLYGKPSSRASSTEVASSVITRMVDRSLLSGTFQRVDPMRYFTVNIRARAEEAIRRRIGDPKIGPKVRRVFAKTGAQSVDELIVAYNHLYPNDSLARKRAIAALSAGPEITVHQREFHEATTSWKEAV